MAHPFRTLLEQLNRFIGELDSNAYAAIQAAENEGDLGAIQKNDFAVFSKADYRAETGQLFEELLADMAKDAQF